MSYLLRLVVCGLLLMFGAAASVQAQDCPPDKSGTFAAMVAPLRFTLTTGQTIQLANLHHDNTLHQNYPGLRGALRAESEHLLRQGTLQIIPAGDDKADGICHAQVFTEAGVWLQEVLVQKGLAPVTHLPHHDAYFSFIIAAERAARRLKTGLWQRPEAFVHDSVSINRFELENSYQFAHGRIGYVHDFNRIILVCIDADPWKSWCSWFLRDAYIQLRDEQGIDLLDKASVIGRRVLMRGDLINRDGLRAFMPLPELIDFLGEDEALLY